MKTIREWYNDLPAQIRKEAIKNASEICLKEKVSCLSIAVESGFFWGKTSQGHDFWDAVVTITKHFENS